MSENTTKDYEIKLNWEQIAKDNNLSMNDLLTEIFAATTNALRVDMNEKNLDSIAVELGEYELILARAKLMRKEYNH